MNTEQRHMPLSLHEHAALVDASKLRAVALRREAIDTFWLAIAHGVHTAWHTLRRDLPRARTHPSLETRPCQR